MRQQRIWRKKKKKKMLVVYYTWSNGNTERIAKMLAEATGADLMQIDTEKPSEGSYNEAVVGKIS